MRPDPDRLLVIADGGLPALVVCMLWPEPEAVSVWVPPAGTPSVECPLTLISARHIAAAEAQADILGLGGVVAGAESPGLSGPSALSRTLLLACERAGEVGAATVVWPVVCGDDLEHLAAAADRARLLSRLWTLDNQAGETHGVRTPLADLNDAEVAELALDLDAPLETLWWRRQPDSTAQIAAEADTRARWEGALREAARAVGAVELAGLTTGANQ